jgi:hypothetical protein
MSANNRTLAAVSGDGQPPSGYVAADATSMVLDAPAPSGMDAVRAEVAAETAPAGGAGVEPGWYTDPADPTVQRYWDGEGWVGQPQPASLPAPVEPPAQPIPAGSTQVSLCGETVYVKPRERWRSSALSALNRGDFDGWAESCLARDADVELWLELDPTIEDIEAMFADYQERTGQSAGKSRGLRRSSTPMRRR